MIMNLEAFKARQRRLIKQASKERKLQEEEHRKQLKKEYWEYYNDNIDRMSDGSDEQEWDDDGFERED